MLGFAEFGASKGRPVFYFHGFPGSRLEASFLHETALSLNARVIGVDRPGYGNSDRQYGRRLDDWPWDIVALADALEIDRFGVIGVSGGAPYALVSAAQHGERISALTVVCGLGPLCASGGSRGMTPRRRFACRLLRLTPWLVPFISGTMGWRLAQAPEEVFKYLLARVPEPDRETLANPVNRNLLQASFMEAVRRGAGGIASDALLYLSAWNFEPSAIRVRTTFWHGELDQTVPARMSRDLSELLPQAELKLFPAEGHYSLPFRYHREILESTMA